MLWEFIEKTKEKDRAYTESHVVYQNLIKELSTLTYQELLMIELEWAKMHSEITKNEEFKKLHYANGGIIDTSNDAFYMDFGHWVVAQGETLHIAFKKDGYMAIVDYIIDHRLPEEEYMFESMIYAFNKARALIVHYY